MPTASRGFSLIEVLIATTITIVGLAGLAHLFVLASAANRAARLRTMAVMLARDKVEELLGAETDSADGTDFVGARGEWLGDSSPPPGTAFVRRWSVSRAPGFSARSRLLIVWIAAPGADTDLARIVAAGERPSR